MALVVKDYGNGSLGDVDSVSSTINSYARVTAVTSSTITIDTSTQITGAATFTVGAKILLHVSATTSSSYKTYLGCWMLANITATSSGTLTLDADPTTCIPQTDFAAYYVQAIAVAQYKNLTLNSGTTVTPPVYNATNFVGGIVAIMCSDTLKFNGGHISLTDKGIPVANAALRPNLSYESKDDNTKIVFADTHFHAGLENFDTKNHMVLNVGDGAAFIVAKTMVCSTNSRIGNILTRGYHFYRGTGNSVTYGETAPSNVTHLGGSTIFVATETITNFTPYMFAKYRSSSSTAGQGVCRCYIASETKLRNDEGLYAYDCISDKGRMKRMLGIRNYGNGSFGDIINPTSQLNNYAKVTAISGNKVTTTGITTDGFAPITPGALVMIHWNHKNSATITDAGRFVIASVLESDGIDFILDRTLPNISTTNYTCQVVSIPQAKNFTLSQIHSATPAFNGTTGGIFAIAASENCNLSAGKIFVPRCTSATAYGRNGLAIIGNAQDSDKLPIGQGHGSIFILAQHLTMDGNTSIGKSNRINLFELYYRGFQYHVKRYYIAVNDAGSGANGGTGIYPGGYGSNSTVRYNGQVDGYAPQGSHIMIVANKITGFSTAALATGGSGGSRIPDEAPTGCGSPGMTLMGSTSSSGNIRTTCSYNGGGSFTIDSNGQYPSGGGGSSGWAFVYCNEVVNQDTADTVLAN